MVRNVCRFLWAVSCNVAVIASIVSWIRAKSPWRACSWRAVFGTYCGIVWHKCSKSRVRTPTCHCLTSSLMSTRRTASRLRHQTGACCRCRVCWVRCNLQCRSSLKWACCLHYFTCSLIPIHTHVHVVWSVSTRIWCAFVNVWNAQKLSIPPCSLHYRFQL